MDGDRKIPQAPGTFTAGRYLPRLAPAVLLGITLLFYYQLWMPGLVLIKRDAYRFFLPMKRYMVERLSSGDLPQWYPYEAMGRSFIGIMSTGIFHPFTALYFMFSVPDAHRIATLLSCVLAALGTFWMARAQRISTGGSVLSGAVFACSGYVVSLTENLQYLHSICLLPLFCLALEHARDRDFRWVAAPAAIWAAVFLNGDGQTGYYYAFIALLWMSGGSSGNYRPAAGRLLCVGALCLLLAGIQIGPAAAVYPNSERMQAAAFHEQAMHRSVHPLRLLTMVVAPGGDLEHLNRIAQHFFGGQPAGSSLAGFWTESIYLGVPVAGLAFLGGWYRRDLWRFVLAGGVALLLSLGKFGGLYEVFYHVVPFWSAFRFPEKLLGIVSFAAAVLAGAGFDEMWKRRGHVPAWLAAAAVFAAMSACVRTEAVRRGMERVFDAPGALVTHVADSLATAALFGALLAFVTWMLLVSMPRKWIGEALCRGLFLVMVILDLSRVNQVAYHVAPVEAAIFDMPLAEAIQRHAGVEGPGHFRILTIRDAEPAFPTAFRESLDLISIGSIIKRQSLDLNHNADVHLESIKAINPGYNTAIAAMMNLADQRMGPHIYGRYNVGYFIGRPQRFKGSQFAGAEVATLATFDLTVFKNPAPVKPRAYVSLRPEQASSPVDLAQLLSRPEFVGGDLDVIEAPLGILPGPSPHAKVHVAQYLPERVQLNVDAPSPAVLILQDAFDAGWSASLEDGRELPILRANALVRAVIVPSGIHTVQFTYRTPLLVEGAVLSIIGILCCLGVLLLGARGNTTSSSRQILDTNWTSGNPETMLAMIRSRHGKAKRTPTGGFH